MASDVEVRFGANTTNFTDGVSRAAKSMGDWEAKARATSEEVVALDNKLTSFFSKIDKGYASQVKMAEGVQLLEDNLKAGNISLATHDALMTSLLGKYAPVTHDAKEAGQAFEVFGLSASRAANGARALLDELSSGRKRQATGTFVRLMVEIAQAEPAAAAAILGLVAVMGTLGAASIHMERFNRALNSTQDALQATGRAADLTRPQIAAMIRSLSEMPGISTTAAEKTVEELARMPELSRPIFDEVMGMVADFAAATGQKAPAAAKTLAAALEDPLAGAQRLDKEFNFLTTQQLLSIQTFVQQGDIMDAQKVIVDALSSRIKGLGGNVTGLQSATNDLENAWNRFMDGIGSKDIFGKWEEGAAVLLNKLHDVHAYLTDDSWYKKSEPGAITQPSPWFNQIAHQSGLFNTPTKHTPGATSADQVNQNLALQKKALQIREQLIPVLSEEYKLKADIHTLESAKKTTSDGNLIAQYDQGITAAKKKLAALGKRSSGGASQMDIWREQFSQMQVDADSFHTANLVKEEAFWQQKLRITKAGSKERIAVENEIHKLQDEGAQNAYQVDIATLRAKQQASQVDMQQRIALEDQMLSLTAQRYGIESTQYQEMLSNKERLEQEFQAKQKADLQKSLADKAQSYQQDLTAQESAMSIEQGHMQTQLKLKKITQQQYDAFLMQSENQRYTAALNELNQEEALWKTVPAKRDAILKKIEDLHLKHAQAIAKIQDQTVLDVQQKYLNMFAPITRAFDTAINGMIAGTQTLRQMTGHILQSILGEWINMAITSASQWAASELAKTAATMTGTTTRQATQTASLAASMATEKAVGLSRVNIGAGDTFAGVMASLAPFMGPAASGPASAAMAEVLSVGGSLVSASGGMWQVPQDTLAMIHKDEQILPAHLAKPMRDMVESGSGGSPGLQIHIHAMDSQDVKRLFMNHGSALHDAIKQNMRHFRT